ncbi:MAG: putative hydrocarbon binding protein [Candidatus Alkanophagales archaeon MCA70_species_1]|nr:putative hydrocarbon binding protein [Candidatus Alkanophaga volatiphilum]
MKEKENVTYESALEEIKGVLEKNWHEGFKRWLSCILDLEKTIDDVIPYDARWKLPDALLYETGVKSGQRVCGWLFERFGLKDKNIKERTLYTDAFFSLSGVGEIEFFKRDNERVLRFKGGTYFAKEHGQVGRPVCHYIAGFIAGATRCFTGKEYVVEEVKCVSAGDEHCEFVVREKKEGEKEGGM